MLSHRSIYLQEGFERIQQRKLLSEGPKEGLTPGSPSMRRKKLPGINADLDGKIQELLEFLEEEKEKNRDLLSGNLAKQEKMIKREKEFKRTLAEYEEALHPFRELSPQDSIGRYRQKLQKSHVKVLEKIDHFQHQTVHFLQEQEKLIVKDMNQELNSCYKSIQDNEKFNTKKKTSASKASLHKEILFCRSEVEKVEMRNNVLQKSNKELVNEFKSYGNDIDVLRNSIALLRQRNFALKNELQGLRDKGMMSKTQSSFAGKPKVVMSERVFTSKNDNRIIESLKRLIEIEKKNLRAARNAYSRELQERSELEDVLRQAIDDIDDGGREKVPSRIGSSMRRLKSAELNSKKDTILLMFSKAFPMKKHSQRSELDEINSDALIEHLDKNILNIEKLYSKHEEKIQSNTERAQMGFS